MSKLRDIVMPGKSCIQQYQQHADSQGYSNSEPNLEFLVLAFFFSIEQKPQICFMVLELAKEQLPLSETWHLNRHNGFSMQIDNLFNTEASSPLISLINALCSLTEIDVQTVIGSVLAQWWTKLAYMQIASFHICMKKRKSLSGLYQRH